MPPGAACKRSRVVKRSTVVHVTKSKAAKPPPATKPTRPKQRAPPPSDAESSGSSSEDEGPRPTLPTFNTLQKFLAQLKDSSNIIVIIGAGVSVSCGIPDFRSEGGVYRMVKKLGLGLAEPEDLFQLEFFQHNPGPFFKFARELFPGEHEPSATHHFLRVLEEQGKLLRVYTQNIDGLEEQAGIERVISCHGSMRHATCLGCGKKFTHKDIKADVLQQRVPHCRCGGVVKPGITFFGESLPASVNRAIESDRRQVDLLLIIGTSLKVAPVSRIIKYMPRAVPQVLINREPVKPPPHLSNGFDLTCLGECDQVVQWVCSQLRWQLPGPQVRCPKPVRAPPNYYYFGGLGTLRARAKLLAAQRDQPQKEESEEERMVDRVTCDTCREVISGPVHSCRECFDYDLCMRCYSRGRNAHSEELGHSFHRTDEGYSVDVAP